MAVFMGAFPVLPGKEDEVRTFAKQTLSRIDEFGAAQARQGVSRVEWSLQRTPMGSQLIVRFDCLDVEKAFAEVGQGTDPFDVWFRDRIKEITGFDPSQPPEGPLPEIIFDWKAEPAPAAG